MSLPGITPTLLLAVMGNEEALTPHLNFQGKDKGEIWLEAAPKGSAGNR